MHFQISKTTLLSLKSVFNVFRRKVSLVTPEFQAVLYLTQEEQADSIIKFKAYYLQIIHVSFQVSPSVLAVEECSDKEYKFSLTPTIPLGNSTFQRHVDYLTICFFNPPGILIDANNCRVKIKDKQTVTVRVIVQCTNGIKGPTKVDKVIIPEIRDFHSLFWNTEMHLPPVWVIPLFVILILKNMLLFQLFIQHF